jgi:hypothetical protein
LNMDTRIDAASKQGNRINNRAALPVIRGLLM